MLCIISALDIEYDNIRKYFRVDYEYRKSSDCVISECNNREIIIVKAGVGKISASKSSKYIISKYKNISHIISTGIAGALSSDLKIGDIILGHTIIDYRQGNSTNVIKSIYNLKCDLVNKMESEQKNIYLKDNDINLFMGKIISSDIIINNENIKQELYLKYDGCCVEMESAGVIKESNKAGIPFWVIKVISDFANENAVISIFKNQYELTDKLGKLLSCINRLLY